ncbi:nuclear transport factor 2 family protein [Rhizobium sp. BK251]|uniref:nuclear transport factor 2 family protein n=1 Tax=Rhizobium sp. BK251 TaxID=2512125 RepID=UPI0010EF41C6|nr:nuclear transport factor 2 family protein [Rhizobium sp. BK251]TCL71291.1 SnoaL-like protein [Rhizobium sp. BK251]
MNGLALMSAIGALSACPALAYAEKISLHDRMAIIDTITDIAAGADRHQWERVRGAFADKVTLDYTSLWGGEPVTQPAEEVVTQWSGFLPGFDETLHLLSNCTIVDSGDGAAVAEADFQALHRIDQDRWSLMGHYRYELTRIDGAWKVTHLVMRHSFESGDRGLVGRAAARAGRIR